ncbi:hypothetical protein [Rhodovulum sp. PH10]|uniref:hypothetical protein n=1 Tax=Rhodovulum sp. PH10 TaxID=1187851 RepID=UPI0012FAEADE|nr:hypothetical protein [Rhodovulum sp. PH10]
MEHRHRVPTAADGNVSGDPIDDPIDDPGRQRGAMNPGEADGRDIFTVSRRKRAARSSHDSLSCAGPPGPAPMSVK